jgi:magnesium transporter
MSSASGVFPSRVAEQALIGAFLKAFPDEVARRLETVSVQRAARLLATQTPRRAAQVIEGLTPVWGARVLSRIAPEAVGGILHQIELMKLAVLLSQMRPKDRDRLLDLLSAPAAREVRDLMTYPPDTAGRLMDPKVMTFRPDMTVEEALARLRTVRPERIHEVFIVDEETRLLGYVPLQSLTLASPALSLRHVMQGASYSVNAMAPKDEVVDLLTQGKLTALPVLDLDGRLLGVIQHEALVTAAQEEATADMLTMVGASKDERALSRVSFAIRKRLPWLEINLGTAFLAAAVVGIFEDTIARNTALAILLPVVAGQSGNTGAQALAVTMRGLALREIRIRDWLRMLVKEGNVGFVNGVAVAATTAFFVFVWSRSLGLSMVIGLSMVLSMTIAGLSGAAVPLLLTSIGQDPAQSSSIVLTTITDVVGFFSFLGIATLLSAML